MSAWKIGVVDGLVFMAVWGTVLVMVTPLQFWAVGCASLLPVVLVVAALGRLQAIELKNEKLSLLQASVGGAKWGAIISAIFVAVVLAFDSHAAGGHLDGQPFFSWATLQYIIVFGAPTIFMGSVAGAAHAAAFYFINYLLVNIKCTG